MGGLSLNFNGMMIHIPLWGTIAICAVLYIICGIICARINIWDELRNREKITSAQRLEIIQLSALAGVLWPLVLLVFTAYVLGYWVAYRGVWNLALKHMVALVFPAIKRIVVSKATEKAWKEKSVP